MSILQKNLQAFCLANPQYSSWLERVPSRGACFVERKNGHDYLIDKGKVIDSTDPHFNNKPSFKKELVNLAIIEGFGLGDILVSVGRKFHSRRLGYIIIEPSIERFITALSIKDYSRVLSNSGILWCIGKNINEVYNQIYMAMFDLWLGPRRKSFEYYSHPIIYQDNKEYFNSVRSQIIQAGDLAYNSFGHQDDCFLGINNTYVNTPSILNTGAYKDLKDLFTGVPALIVATGPSLNHSIEKIKALKDKCIIIAADASYKILIDNGIVPHFVTTLERVDLTIKFFKDIKSPDTRKKSSLVTFPLSPKATLDVFDGPIFLAYRNYNYFKYLERQVPKGIENCGHSVSHLACKLADHLGCSLITLIGQDLCYSSDLKTHAEGVSHGDTKKKTLEELKKYAKEDSKGNIHVVQGNLEPSVVTNDLWIYFMKEFITEQEQTKAQIINCTLGGATIPTIPWVHLDEVTRSWTKLDNVFPKIQEKYKLSNKNSIDLTLLFSQFDSLFKLYKRGYKSLKKAKDNKLKFSKRKKFLNEIENLKNELSKNTEFLGYVYESDVKLFMGIEESTYIEPLSEDNILDHVYKWEEWISNLERITIEVKEVVLNATKNYKDLIKGLPS